ncbi:3',5'-cyclic adenosine monophosphate phosphodiesterase CpdA [compost metagenome]
MDLFAEEKDVLLFGQDKFDKQREEIQKYIEEKYSGREVKILNIADLHIPFTDFKAVNKILLEHSDANILVINGDLLDLFAVSKYAKDKEVALKREIAECREFLDYVSKRFEDVVITDGNHERRLRNFIVNVIPTDLQFLFPDNVLKVVADGRVIEKDQLQGNVHLVGSWWIKLFDTIYAHPDNYSNVNLRTVQNTSEFFKLVQNIDHRMCIIGHTHRAGWIVSGGVKLMETGCLCHEMDYHNGSKFIKTKWTKAYSVAYFDKFGAADFTRSVVNLA